MVFQRPDLARRLVRAPAIEDADVPHPPHRIGVLADLGHLEGAVVGVVDRHGDQEAPEAHVVVQRGDRAHVGQQRLAHAQMGLAIAQVPVLDRADAIGRVLEGHLGQDGVGLHELDAVQVAVQPIQMERIQYIIVQLEPVVIIADQGLHVAAELGQGRWVQAPARQHDLALVQVLGEGEAREGRLLLRRAHVGPDQAEFLDQRIPGLARAGRRLGPRLTGHLQHMAFRVEQPAVVAAADAALLDLAVEQGGAAVHAARIEQARTPRSVAEQDQLLVQDPDQPRQPARLLRTGERLPVTAQQLPAPGPRPAQHQVLVRRRPRPAIGAPCPVDLLGNLAAEIHCWSLPVRPVFRDRC